MVSTEDLRNEIEKSRNKLSYLESLADQLSAIEEGTLVLVEETYGNDFKEIHVGHVGKISIMGNGPHIQLSKSARVFQDYQKNYKFQKWGSPSIFMPTISRITTDESEADQMLQRYGFSMKDYRAMF